jgi:hypothetical protein
MPRTATLALLALFAFAGPAGAQIDTLPSGGKALRPGAACELRRLSRGAARKGGGS